MNPAKTAAPEHPLSLTPLITGYWASQLVFVAAKLGLADLVAAGPKAATDLAAATGTHADTLYRVLRALAGLGLFREDDAGRFANTDLSNLLRSDVAGTQRPLALMMGNEHFRCWGELLYSVQTGRNAFEKIYGKRVFPYLAEHPEEGAIFDAAMTAVHGRETAAMITAYDFAGVATLADIGGGNGSLLSSVLHKHTAMRGILFDMPAVVERARPKFAASGLADRCALVPGDFFQEVAGGADAYLMRHIIHDWEDELSLRILRNVRRVIPSAGRLLLVEMVIPPGNDPSFGKLLDINMLVIPGGRERTEQQYRELYADAGFELTRIVPTGADVSVIEGRPV